jgi:hypothetical protein
MSRILLTTQLVLAGLFLLQIYLLTNLQAQVLEVSRTQMEDIVRQAKIRQETRP